jgi:histidinol-phosphate aminotransferase
MKFKPHIQEIQRYIVNDEDRSGCLRLDKNEYNVDLPAEILDQLRGCVTSYVVQAYPSTYGTLSTASKLLDYGNQDGILLTPGSDYGLKLCYEALLEPGDKVGLPYPTYAMNEVFAKLGNHPIVNFEYGPNLQIKADALFAGLDEISMFVLANPNQPTGRLETDALIQKLVAECRTRDIWLVVDEAYFEFSGYTAAKYIAEYPNLIVLRSFSKGYGMAGLRLGAALSQPNNIRYLGKAMPVYAIDAFALAALEVLLGNQAYFRQVQSDLRDARTTIETFYNARGCRALPSDTNFVMVESNSLFDTNLYISELKKRNILIRGPWRKHPYTDAFRVTTSSPANIEILKKVTAEIL